MPRVRGVPGARPTAWVRMDWQALIARNVNLDPIAKWSKEGLQIHESAVPIGATPEYLAGHYMIQSASSFLPVMALAPLPGQRVLDMAAAPGGKTTHLAALMGNSGTLVANDFKKPRIKALQGNLCRMGVRCCVVVNADGREFPKLMGGFDRVLPVARPDPAPPRVLPCCQLATSLRPACCLRAACSRLALLCSRRRLDAPCTGLGVISKDPSVKAEKGAARSEPPRLPRATLRIEPPRLPRAPPRPEHPRR